MSKITDDGLTRSGKELLNSCTHMATVGVNGLTYTGTLDAAAASVTGRRGTLPAVHVLLLLIEPRRRRSMGNARRRVRRRELWRDAVTAGGYAATTGDSRFQVSDVETDM